MYSLEHRAFPEVFSIYIYFYFFHLICCPHFDEYKNVFVSVLQYFKVMVLVGDEKDICFTFASRIHNLQAK